MVLYLALSHCLSVTTCLPVSRCLILYRPLICELQDRIAAWNSDELPIHEPGLLEIVQASSLVFTHTLILLILTLHILYSAFSVLCTPSLTVHALFHYSLGKADNAQTWCSQEVRGTRLFFKGPDDSFDVIAEVNCQ